MEDAIHLGQNGDNWILDVARSAIHICEGMS